MKKKKKQEEEYITYYVDVYMDIQEEGNWDVKGRE
jgi:hypothetical protein